MTPSGLFPPETLRALLDRLVPRDDFPGAIEAGVENYLHRFLATDGAREAAALAQGLTQLDREAAARHDGARFSLLPTEQQDALLRDIEAGKTDTPWPVSCPAPGFFARMVELAHEGFYADPENGGNLHAISWQMIGYQRRVPTPLTPRPSA